MPTRLQRVTIVMLTILAFGRGISAQQPVTLTIQPDIREIFVSVGSQGIFITAKPEQELQFAWRIAAGPGKLEGDLTSPAILYIPPDKIEGAGAQVIIIVNVTTIKGEKGSASVTFTLRQPPTPTPTPTLTPTLTPTSTPTQPLFSIDDLKWQAQMEQAFAEAQAFEQQNISPDLKRKVWERFLNAFVKDDPASTRDDELRKQAKERIGYWNSATPTPTPTSTPTPIPTATPTTIPIPSPTATPIPNPTKMPTPKPKRTATPTPKPTPKPKRTATPTPKPTATPRTEEWPTLEPTVTIMILPSPTEPPMPIATHTPIAIPTFTPVAPPELAQPDTHPPVITILSPEAQSVVTADTVAITGRVEDESAIKQIAINGKPIPLAGKRGFVVQEKHVQEFTYQVTDLKPGLNEIVLAAWDAFGNIGTATIRIRITRQ